LVNFSFTHGDGCEKEFAKYKDALYKRLDRDILKEVNNLKTKRYLKKETSMNDRSAFFYEAADSSFLI